jgi:hypothetical protein
MRVEAAVFAGLGFVATPWALVYALTSDDEAGAVMLVLLAVAFLFVAVYLLVRSRTVGTRPEDDPEGEPVAGDDLGYYPTASVWPITLAVATTVIGYGLVFSGWVAFPGIALLVLSVTAWAVEVQRSRRTS